MAKVLALDIGTKRTGVAETDPLQIIASGLPTVATNELIEYLTHYVTAERPELLVVGEPKRMHGAHSDVEVFIQSLLKRVSTKFPELKIERIDERFTSKMASAAIAQSGLPKKKRQDKGLVDEVSAVLILQSWLAKKK